MGSEGYPGNDITPLPNPPLEVFPGGNLKWRVRRVLREVRIYSLPTRNIKYFPAETKESGWKGSFCDPQNRKLHRKPVGKLDIWVEKGVTVLHNIVFSLVKP